ncbi:hypothetical protein [Streptomyces sp. NPDC058045]|uniref:hypothetical protein n=1 Tax=Streptomyces sp. NPDC058045 TaxID=3346311 RepID=UPI0036E3FBAF
MADIRRRLRAGTVLLGGVALLATTLTACSSDHDKRCVDRGSYRYDRGYRVVSDKDCNSGSRGDWYYGGSSKSGWVEGGSFTKPRSGTSAGNSGGSHRKHGGYGKSRRSGSRR